MSLNQFSFIYFNWCFYLSVESRPGGRRRKEEEEGGGEEGGGGVGSRKNPKNPLAAANYLMTASININQTRYLCIVFAYICINMQKYAKKTSA